MDVSGFADILGEITEQKKEDFEKNNANTTDKHLQNHLQDKSENIATPTAKTIFEDIEVLQAKVFDQPKPSNPHKINEAKNRKNSNIQAVHSGHRQRARERFLLNPDNASDYDLLELLLFLIIPRADTKPLARLLIDKYKTIKNVFNADIEELNQLGVNGNALHYLYTLNKTFIKKLLQPNINKQQFIASDIEQIAEYCMSTIGDLQTEEFHVLLFDSQFKLIADDKFKNDNSAIVNISMKEIIQKVIASKTNNVVLTHNHPSGNLEPSVEDIKTTNEIKTILNTIDVALIDHIIVSGDKYFSMMNNNLL